MKKHVLSYLIMSIPLFLSAQDPDTAIRKVYIGFNYSTDIFPESWRPAPVNAWGEQIDRKEIQRSKTIIAIALNKYPEVIFEYNLKHV